MRKLFLNIELKSLPYFFEYMGIRYFDKFKKFFFNKHKMGILKVADKKFFLYLNENDYGTSRDIYIFQKREILSANYFIKFVEEEDIMLDIGSHIGMYTILAMSSGCKKIYAFEPIEDNFNILLKNIEMYKKLYNVDVFTFKCAIANHDGYTRMNSPKQTNLSRISNDGNVIVKCVSFGRIIKKFRPTLVKMDIEGYEYDLIVNNVKELTLVDKIFMEFHPHLLKENEVVSVLLKLKNCGFDIEKIFINPFPSSFPERVKSLQEKLGIKINKDTNIFKLLKNKKFISGKYGGVSLFLKRV